MKERILITGGAGYIGSHLVEVLADSNAEIRVLDNFSMSSPRNLMDTTRPIDLHIGDIRKKEDVERAMRGVDTVVHLAALTGAETSDEQRQRTFDINLNGTKTLLETVRDEQIDKFVFASSCNLYGYGRDNTEATDPQPPNAYAESKFAGEELVREIEDDGINVSCLRMATNYGYSPGIRFNLVVNLFSHRAAYGEPMTVYGDGTNWRPFVHVKDSARAFAHAAFDDEFPTIVNVGSTEQNYRIGEIAQIIDRKTAGDVDIEYLGDKDPGPDYHVCFDRLSETEFELEYTLEKGVKELLSRFNGRLQPPISEASDD